MKKCQRRASTLHLFFLSKHLCRHKIISIDNFDTMDAILSSLRNQYAVETFVVVEDPAQLPTTTNSTTSTDLRLSVKEASSCTVDRLVSSIQDDMTRLMRWGDKSSASSKSSKYYMKQCRWSSVTILHSKNRLSATPGNIKKDVSPTRPTRR